MSSTEFVDPTPRTRPPRAAGVAPTVAAGILWGTSGTSQALAPPGGNSLVVGTLRIAIGAAGMVAWVLAFGGLSGLRGCLAPKTRGYMLLGGACVAVYQVCFFAGMARTGVAVGTLITLGTAPVTTGLLAWVIGEKPTGRWALATAAAVVGEVVLILGHGGDVRTDPLGVAFSLCASCAYAAYTVVARRLIVRGEHGPTVLTGFFTIGAVMLCPFLVTAPLAWVATVPGAVTMLWLGLVATSAGYLLFERGLKWLPAGTVSTLALTEPVTATVLSVVILGEHLSLVSSTGVVVILGGLLIAGLSTRKQ